MISWILYLAVIVAVAVWWLILSPRMWEIDVTPVRQVNRFSTADYEDQLMRNSAQLRYRGVWMWRTQDGYGCDIDRENCFDTIRDMKNFIHDCQRLQAERETRRSIKRIRQPASTPTPAV